MDTDTTKHEPVAKPADGAHFAHRRRHPGPGPTPEAASTQDPAPPAPDSLADGYTFRTWTRLHRRDRRLHLTVAIAVSIAAHIGLIVLPEESEKTLVAHSEPARAVELLEFEMPEPEETPVETEDSEPAEAPAEFAPPMQADLPSLVNVDSFVQPMQPPVPAGISTDMEMMVVPTTIAVGSGSGAPKLFEITELDRVPTRIRSGMPNYPPEFRRSLKEGDVRLLVMIDPAGHVKVIKVLESTHPEFTRAAITAAEQSLYESPRKGGAAVSAQYTLRVPFRLAPGG